MESLDLSARALRECINPGRVEHARKQVLHAVIGWQVSKRLIRLYPCSSVLPPYLRAFPAGEYRTCDCGGNGRVMEHGSGPTVAEKALCLVYAVYRSSLYICWTLGTSREL